MTVFVLRAATSMDLNCKFTIEHLHQTTTTKTTKKKKRKEDEEKVLTPNILTVAFLLYSNFLIAPSIQRISQFFLHLSIENVWAVEKFTHQRKCSLSLSLSNARSQSDLNFQIIFHFVPLRKCVESFNLNLVCIETKKSRTEKFWFCMRLNGIGCGRARRADDFVLNPN